MKKLILIFLVNLASSRFSFAESFFKDPDSEVLKNGVKCFIFNHPTIPLVDIIILNRHGSVDDPNGKSGLAQLWVKSLSRAHAGLTSAQVAQKIENLGASRQFSVDEDLTTVSVHGLSVDFNALNRILKETFNEPDFLPDDIEFVKKQLLSSWSHIIDSPESLLQGIIRNWINQGTEYERGLADTQAEFRHLTPEDVKLFHQSASQLSESSAIIIVGPISKFPADWRENLHKTWGNQSKNSTHKISISKLKSKKKINFPAQDEVAVVHRSGSVQSTVGVAFSGPAPNSNLFFNSQVSQVALGETYNSRLNMRLREELELTYGIESGFSINAKYSYYLAVANTASAKTGTLLFEMKDIIKRYGEGPVMENEIKSAVDYLKGAYPMSMPTVYSFASKYVSQWIMRRPLNEIRDFLPKLEKISFEDLSKDIRKVFEKPFFKTVIVGDSAQIIPQLKKMKIKFKVIDSKEAVGILK